MEVIAQNNSYHQPEQQILHGVSYSFVWMVLGAIACGLLNIVYFCKTRIIQKAYNTLKTAVYRLFGDQSAQSEEPPVVNLQNNDDPCGICQMVLQHPLQFLCRHELCGKCFFDYWQSKNRQQLNCPLCRRKITLVMRKYQQLPNFQESNETKIISNQVRDYNLRFSREKRSIIQQLRDMPFLLEQTMQFISTWTGFVYFLGRFIFNYRIFMLIIYLLSPFDLIPEFIFGVFGLIDDLVVFAVLMVVFSNIYYNFQMRRDQQQQNQQL